VIIVAISIVFLAYSIDTYNQIFLATHQISNLHKDIFYKTLGEFKDFLSDISLIKADVYFHGGTYDFRKHEKDNGEHALHIAEGISGKHGNHDIREHGHIEYHIKPSLNILLDVGKTIQIAEHRHLSGKEEKEILPWLYYSIRLNPHNIMAYSVGGFWLAVKLKKPDEAIVLLKEGITNNPESWEIYETLGHVYYFNKKDYKNAEICLEKAKEFGDKANVDKFEKRNIYTLLAEIYVKKGMPNKALLLYKTLLNLFPENETIRRHIREITSPR